MSCGITAEWWVFSWAEQSHGTSARQSRTGGNQPREGGEYSVLLQTLRWPSFLSWLFYLSVLRKRILTQTVCRAVSAVQTAQPQYVASNCFVKHMHQLYLFALKLWEPQTLLRKFSFHIDIKSLTVLSNVPCCTRQWAANLPWPMKLFRF